ncbi:unnamed protein product [Lymnaea stagnalis]|uniref:Uncharacterized protein n=1 Tax=Lymnaea stagnalis TaxID=6523 RepID=A0AAV2HZB1_LYMST
MGCGGSRQSEVGMASKRTDPPGEPEQRWSSDSSHGELTKDRPCSQTKNAILDVPRSVSAVYAKHHGGDGPFNCVEPKRFFIDEFTEGGVNVYVFPMGQKAEKLTSESPSMIHLVRPTPIAATARSTSTPGGFLDQADLSAETILPPEAPAEPSDKEDVVPNPKWPLWKVVAYIRKRTERQVVEEENCPTMGTTQ